MKKFLISTSKYASALLLTGILLGSSPAAQAKNAEAQKVDSTYKVNPSLRFIESTENSSLLFLSFEAPGPVSFNLEITDEFGEVLYLKSFETAVLKKFLKFVMEPGAEDRNIYVTLKAGASGETHRFEVSSRVTTIPTIEIARF